MTANCSVAWCVIEHDCGPFDEDGSDFHYGIDTAFPLERDPSGTWSRDGDLIGGRWVRFDDMAPDAPIPCETRMGIAGGEAMMTAVDLRDYALWLLLRADELDQLNGVTS